jgi:RNA polymerase sigma-54 factor
MSLPEEKFGVFIRDLENDPLFRKLAGYAAPGYQKVIRLSRFPQAGFSFQFCNLREELNRDTSGCDVEALVGRSGEAAAVIRRMGLEKFETCFLYADGNRPAGDIAAACGLTVEDVAKVHALLNDISVHTEFFYPSVIRPEARVRYSRIAAVEDDGAGRLIPKFYSPRFAAGKYQVDVPLLDSLKKGGFFSAEEEARLFSFLGKLELVNSRKSTLYQIVLRIIERQRAYLLSGDERRLVPCTQAELARTIGVDESIISRAIHGKSIVTPRLDEKPLRFFAPSRKMVRTRFIREIIAARDGKITDNDIRAILKEQYGISVSRRTVNASRTPLKEW